MGKGEKCMKKAKKVVNKILIGLLLGLLLCGILYLLLIQYLKPNESTFVPENSVETVDKSKFGLAMPGDQEPTEEAKQENKSVEPIIRKNLEALREPQINVSPSNGDQVETVNQNKINSKDSYVNK